MPTLIGSKVIASYHSLYIKDKNNHCDVPHWFTIVLYLCHLVFVTRSGPKAKLSRPQSHGLENPENLQVLRENLYSPTSW